jgi:inositol transport system ATP-binding protein
MILLIRTGGYLTVEQPILELKDITKSFPGVLALNQVSFDLYPGEVHVLMGENGAGKSTLMKIINGQYHSDCGEVILNGQVCRFESPHESILAGIAMIHQELNPVLDLTVAENIFLGREIGKSGLYNHKAMLAAAREALLAIDLDLDPRLLMRELTVAQMQMVEIAKAVSLNASILIMDEPTSAISEREVDSLFTLIGKLKLAKVGIIYISHKMSEIFRIADRITVLRDGCSIETRAAANFNQDSLIKLMVGRELNQIFPKKSDIEYGTVLLSVKNLSLNDHFKDVSFSIRAGEVLGFAGLMGAGRSELVETVFGIRKASSGQVFVHGKPVKIKNPTQAIANGLALITEDRKKTGLNLKASVREDTSIVTLNHYCRFVQVIQRKLENKAVQKIMNELRVKMTSLNQSIRDLSGGNQQKVIIARWILNRPEILILDEPTRGIDVGAKFEIYSIIAEMAAEGKAIIIVSSEMPELIGVCDRCLVMCEGQVTGELSRDQLTQENVMYLAASRMDSCHVK